MTEEEARKVSKIVQTADHGCEWCAGRLEALLNHYFPQFEWGSEDNEAADDWEVEDCEKKSPSVLYRKPKS